MATIRKFCCNDLLRFTSVNLDHLATTIEMSIYLTCLAKRPRYFFHVAVAPGNRIIGYIIGKTEEESKGEQSEGEESKGEESEGEASEEEEFESEESEEEEEFVDEESEGERQERLKRELWKTLDDLAMVEKAASDSEGEFEGEHWQGLAVTVHVAPEYRRLGFATRLMRLFEQLLVDKMVLSPSLRDREYYTFLHVVNDNTPAKLFFEQCGYEVTRITKDFYMTDEDEEIDSYEMRKVLSVED